MPFVKSNWACTPAIQDGGYFEFGQDYQLKNLTLKKAEQSRPCFVHVSSEVECLVRVLSVVASVEILDIYALVGPLDSFDYRHVSKIQGAPTDPSSTRFIFRIDPNVIPQERVWQLQFKLSSSAQGIISVQIDELSVQVERTNGLADFERTGKSTATSDMSSMAQSTTRGAFFSSGRSNLSTSIGGRSLHRGISQSEGLNETGGGGGGGGIGFTTTSTSNRTTGEVPTPIPYVTGRSTISSLNASSRQQTATTTTMSSTLMGTTGTLDGSNIHPPPPTHSRSSRVSSAASSMGRSVTSSLSATLSGMDLSNGGVLGGSTSTSVARQAAMTGELALRGRSLVGGSGGGTELAVQGGGGASHLGLREETAAVASVLNAVCEKMVGVVSEKTKAYLAKAGKRTERRVLDKMQKLEERIEKFDQVLEHATLSSKEIEQALLALDKDLVSSSPHAAFAAGSPLMIRTPTTGPTTS